MDGYGKWYRLRQVVSAVAGRQGKGSAERGRMWGKEGQGTVPLAVHTPRWDLTWGSKNAFTALVPSSLGNNSGTVPAHCHGQFIFSHGFFASFSFLFSLRLLPSLAINLSEWNHTTDIPPNLFTNQKNRQDGPVSDGHPAIERSHHREHHRECAHDKFTDTGSTIEIRSRASCDTRP